MSLPEDVDININNTLKKQWNGRVKTLLADKKFRAAVQRLVDIDLNERTLKNILVCFM